MAYPTFSFYQNTYHGTAIQSEEAFLPLCMRAAMRIDAVTRGGAQAYMAENPNCTALQSAACAMADVFCEEAARKKEAHIKTEIIGQHHVTYERAPHPHSAAGQEDTERQLLRIAATYLFQTGLLYRGVALC